MLTYISIKNYLTVNSLELNFQTGMTAITGETGSGKSILIGALNATLGHTTPADLISKGEDKLEVITMFNIKSLINVQSFLKDFEYYEGDELILRRIVTIEGKNKCFINGNVCKMSDLKKLSELLVTFHDQNQQHNLVRAKRQLNLLDNYAENQDIALEVKKLFNLIKSEKDKLFKLKNNFEESNALHQLLSYQIEEIDLLELKPNEYSELEEDSKKMTKSSDYILELDSAIHFLNGDDESGSILSYINNLKKHLSNIEDKSKEYSSIIETVETAYINLKEANDMISIYKDNFDTDPEKLSLINERIYKIFSIAKKHKTNPDKLTVLHKELKERLEKLNYSEMNLETVESNIEKYTEEYLVKAKELRLSRINSIPLLEKEINIELVKLKFNENIFSIYLEPNISDYPYDSEDQFTEHGLDSVTFYIEPNLGQDKQLLSKAASGGELSRISLVLELISSRKNNVPTLIFDEVDSGIGGETGDSVGNLLNEIGNNNQLFVITHLPQVAAKSNNHIIVKKSLKASVTKTFIETIEENEKVNEIARMLGGTKQISSESWNYAKNLIDGNKE